MPKCLGWQSACRDFGGNLSWHGQCPKLIVGYLYVPEAWVASESAGRRLDEERYSSPALELNTHGSHQMPYLLPAMLGDGPPLAVQVVPHEVAPATRFISPVSFSARHRSLRLPPTAELSTKTGPDGGAGAGGPAVGVVGGEFRSQVFSAASTALGVTASVSMPPLPNGLLTARGV